MALLDDVSEVLIREDELRDRIAGLGRQISGEYEGKTPLLVGILKGASIFLADLIRQVTIPCMLDFMATSSYGAGTENSGIVRILKDLDQTIEGRHVLIKGTEILGIYDTDEEAREVGLQRYLLQPFFVHPIRSEEPYVRIRGINYPWPTSPLP